uniref:Uncharacterized protein n=1 Tax=Abalone asfa-like virus TaxID=2839893 RepID=A0A5K7Y325_9VIRU|nr:hypothetical protein [Abalone asfa-like virus]BCY04519.1 hypothetical protein [Abalone asfa-like virus]
MIGRIAVGIQFPLLRNPKHSFYLRFDTRILNKPFILPAKLSLIRNAPILNLGIYPSDQSEAIIEFCKKNKSAIYNSHFKACSPYILQTDVNGTQCLVVNMLSDFDFEQLNEFNPISPKRDFPFCVLGYFDANHNDELEECIRLYKNIVFRNATDIIVTNV